MSKSATRLWFPVGQGFGLVGAAGDAGDAGDSGDSGEAGDSGDVGEAGEIGDTGESGELDDVAVPAGPESAGPLTFAGADFAGADLAGRLRGVLDAAGSSAIDRGGEASLAAALTPLVTFSGSGCSSSGVWSSLSQTAPSGGRVTAAEAT